MELSRPRTPRATVVAAGVVLMAIALASLTSCGSAWHVADGVVEMKEWRLASGRPVHGILVVHNVGKEYHDLVVTTPDGHPVATTGLLDVGDTARIHVPDHGRFVLTCRVIETNPDGSIEDHVQKGLRLAVDWSADQVASAGDGHPGASS